MKSLWLDPEGGNFISDYARLYAIDLWLECRNFDVFPNKRTYLGGLKSCCGGGYPPAGGGYPPAGGAYPAPCGGG